MSTAGFCPTCSGNCSRDAVVGVRRRNVALPAGFARSRTLEASDVPSPSGITPPARAPAESRRVTWKGDSVLG